MNRLSFKTAFSGLSKPLHTALLGIFLLMAALPAGAQVVLTDTVPVAQRVQPRYVQYLDLSYAPLRIQINGVYAVVGIYQDTADYVAVRLDRWEDTATVRDGLFYLTFSNRTGDLDLFVLGLGKDGIIEVHTRNPNLFILSSHTNYVFVTSGDTMRFNNLGIQADEYSMVEVLNPCVVANTMQLHANNSATIRYGHYTCKTFIEDTWEHGTIIGYLRNDDEIKRPLNNKHQTNWKGIRSTPPKMFWANGYYPIDRTHINLYSGLNTYFGHYDTDVPAKISLGNLQAEITYDIVARHHFTFGLGLGYGYNNFTFRDPYIRYYDQIPVYDEMTGLETGCYGHYNFLSEDIPFGEEQYWHSNAIVQQITLPIHFSYYCDQNHNYSKGLHFSADIVFGYIFKGRVHQRYGESLGTGVDEYTGNHYEQFLNYSKYDNFYGEPQFDIRLSAGRGAWNLFIQSGFNRITGFGGQRPHSFGIKISL